MQTLTKPAFGKRDKALAGMLLRHMQNANPPTVILWRPGVDHALRHCHLEHDPGAWEPSLKQRRPQAPRNVGPMTAREVERSWLDTLARALRNGSSYMRIEPVEPAIVMQHPPCQHLHPGTKL